MQWSVIRCIISRMVESTYCSIPVKVDIAYALPTFRLMRLYSSGSVVENRFRSDGVGKPKIW